MQAATKGGTGLGKLLRNARNELPSLLTSMLEMVPERRLGSRSAAEVMQHEFFQGVDWSCVGQRKLHSPLRSFQWWRQAYKHVGEAG